MVSVFASSAVDRELEHTWRIKTDYKFGIKVVAYNSRRKARN